MTFPHFTEVSSLIRFDVGLTRALPIELFSLNLRFWTRYDGVMNAQI